jgi:hypothetical protein
MDSLNRMYQKAFLKKKVMDNEEFAQSMAHISRDISKAILRDFEQMGWVKVERKGRRIYDKRNLI